MDVRLYIFMKIIDSENESGLCLWKSEQRVINITSIFALVRRDDDMVFAYLFLLFMSFLKEEFWHDGRKSRKKEDKGINRWL
jgi:hypothetical protein